MSRQKKPQVVDSELPVARNRNADNASANRSMPVPNPSNAFGIGVRNWKARRAARGRKSR